MSASLDAIRHSLAHLLAHAVMEQFPETKFAIGPVIDTGFYYDFGLPRPLTEGDLPKLEKRMRHLIKQALPFEQLKPDAPAAKASLNDQPFKHELIADLKKEKTTISFYKVGDFTDLCRGGHVKNTADIPADGFRLDAVAGAYWRGSEKNPMLTRVYGLAFGSAAELKTYYERRRLAEERDHRKIGRELDLFITADEVGQGLPLLTERGATIFRELERFVVDEELKRGYHHVRTPDLARVKLYELSGHYPFYKDTMYPVMKIDEDELVLRPMTCPHHFMLYRDKRRSYRELPLRIAEVGKCYRYEKSGELTGLVRVRGFSLADAHIFCRSNQAEDVVREVIEFIDDMVGTLGFVRGEDYRYRLSLGDRKNKDKYFQAPKAWDHGEKVLRNVLVHLKAPFVEAPNEAAFYGPKIDIQMKNVLGKEDTAFTVQYDLCLPARFKLTYVGESGKDEQPVVIHRSSIGALERTMAFLIEKYGGAFPLWLSPVQVAILPVGSRHVAAAQKLGKEFREAGLRVDVDDANETVGNKIRKASQQKIPYLIVLGDKEIEESKLVVRKRGREELITLPKATFLKRTAHAVASRSLKLP